MRATHFLALALIPLAASFLGAQERAKTEAPAEEAKPEEELFSGPQVGEKIPSFKVRGVLGNEGKELDFVKQADGKPLVLVFVHDVNRPSIGMTRVLTSYTTSRAKDGLETGVVFLSDDATAAEERIKRISLTDATPTGVSMEGKEGPGSYGLNRKVTLTILVGKEGKVTANFALVQPSLQADLPKVLKEVVAVAGGKVPKLEDIAGAPEMMRRDPKAGPNLDELRGLIRPVIKLDAKPEEVDEAAAAVEKYVAKDEAARKEVGRIANTIINAGKLKDYGTPKAQEYFTKWAKEYGDRAKEGKKEAPKDPKGR
jgi:hypothetical protein